MSVCKEIFQGDFQGLGLSLDCGQTFRWKVSGHTAMGIVAGTIVVLNWNDTELALAFDADTGLTREFWEQYLGLSNPEWNQLKEFLEKSKFAGQEVCLQALEKAPGMSILKQDPWECLISFIISQQNQIPRIKYSVETLSQKYGKPLELGAFKGCSFPTPIELASASEQDLMNIRLGYRSKYIRAATEYVLQHPDWIEKWGSLPPVDLKERLMSLQGVGPKVASCVALYGFGVHSEFPVDVWIQRVIDRYFEGINPAKRFGKLAGLMQQCLFYYIRPN